jgi:DnaJ family protein C protein 9
MPTNIDDLELDDPPSVEPYEVLAVETTATQDQIKTAYRKAALKWHPGELTLPAPFSPHPLTRNRQGQT